MNKHKYLIIYTIMAAAVAGSLVFLFFLLFEQVEIQTQTPPSRMARQNPFLAAERYLNESGTNAKSVTSRDILVNLPSPADMIFINRLGGNLPPEREDRLIEWIERGGTLVITADKFWDDDREKSGDTLLDRLGVRLYDGYTLIEETDTDEPDDDVPVESTDQAPESEHVDESQPDGCNAGNDKETIRVEIDHETFAELEFDKATILIDVDENASEYDEGELGAHILSKSIGTGKLVVLSDNHFMTNSFIIHHDHAFYLSCLSENRDCVWILYNSIMPSFFSILLKHVPILMVSMVVLFIVSMFWLTLQIGPQRTLYDHSSRNILEHLLSSGHFIRKHGIKNFHIHHVRSVIEKNITAKYLHFGRKTKEQQYDLIAQWTQLPVSDVYSAFNADVNSSHACVKITGILQKIYVDILVDNKTMKEGVIGKNV